LGAKELEHGQQLAVGAGILLEGVRRGLPHPSVPILTAVAVKTPSVQGISKKTETVAMLPGDLGLIPIAEALKSATSRTSSHEVQSHVPPVFLGRDHELAPVTLLQSQKTIVLGVTKLMVFVYTFLSNILNCTHHYLLAFSFIPARLIL
jgi:hypothetical protein